MRRGLGSGRSPRGVTTHLRCQRLQAALWLLIVLSPQLSTNQLPGRGPGRLLLCRTCGFLRRKSSGTVPCPVDSDHPPMMRPRPGESVQIRCREGDDRHHSRRAVLTATQILGTDLIEIQCPIHPGGSI